MIETREYPVPLTDEELKTAADFVGLIHKSIQDREAAASLASVAFTPLAITQTLTVLPRPAGNTVVERTC